MAAFRVSDGEITLGSLKCTLGAMANSFISSMKLRLLLLAVLSVPIATFILLFRSFGMLHTPLANFKLLAGFEATVTFLSLRISKSFPSIQTQ